MKKKRLILASKSPRRNEILKNLGLEFTVVTTDTDESSVSPDNISVDMYVQELAMLKAADCMRHTLSDDELIVISADTVVTIDGKVLGKPENAESAFLMLKSLSGRIHEVYTGFCIMRNTDAKSVCEACRTKVQFKELTDEEIWDYIRTDEYKDKAGSYGIQGLGALLVSGIEGDYLNVVGLPVSRISDVLKNEFDYNII